MIHTVWCLLGSKEGTHMEKFSHSLILRTSQNYHLTMAALARRVLSLLTTLALPPTYLDGHTVEVSHEQRVPSSPTLLEASERHRWAPPKALHCLLLVRTSLSHLAYVQFQSNH
jgi:hypothetical protein